MYLFLVVIFPISLCFSRFLMMDMNNMMTTSARGNKDLYCVSPRHERQHKIWVGRARPVEPLPRSHEREVEILEFLRPIVQTFDQMTHHYSSKINYSMIMLQMLISNNSRFSLPSSSILMVFSSSPDALSTSFSHHNANFATRMKVHQIRHSYHGLKSSKCYGKVIHQFCKFS